MDQEREKIQFNILQLLDDFNKNNLIRVLDGQNSRMERDHKTWNL